jgi:hypothetical protein
VKSYEVRLYTHNGALREIETSQAKSAAKVGVKYQSIDALDNNIM